MNISHEILSRDEARAVADYDSGARGWYKDSTVKSRALFARRNAFTYYVAINTWLNIIKDCDEWAAQAVRNMILRSGLISTVKDAISDADLLVKGKEPVTEVGVLLVHVAKGRRKSYFGLDPDRNVFRDDLATSLQLLRYLKRMSLLNDKELEEASLADFKTVENANKLKQRREYPVWLIEEIRCVISDLLPWAKFVKFYNDLSIMDFSLPTGTTAEGLTTLGSKLDYIAHCYPEAFIMPMGFPYVFPHYMMDQDDRCVRVQAVPKSIKSSRIIAMEHVWRQSISNTVAKYLSTLLPSDLDITDQTRNQLLAEQGSRDGSVATLDASHASDMITKTHMRSVFPPDVVRILDYLFSDFWEIGEQRRTMQMMSTAGHSLTFIFETIFYYAVAEAAARIYTRFTGQRKSLVVSAYGDDVILSSEIAPLAIELYSYLGLKINEDKSFISGPYRESCGEEYYDGIRLSTVYYPRFPVVGDLSSKSISLGVRMYRDTYRGKIDDSTTMLVDLQKRLFGISYGASMFVWDIVSSVHPKMTSSRYGEICNDLWGAVALTESYNPAERLLEKGFNVPSSVIQACAARKHSYASIRYSLPKGYKLSEEQERVFNAYKYYHFLKTGPTYASPLDELLGVSDPPVDIEAMYGSGQLIWRYQID